MKSCLLSGLLCLLLALASACQQKPEVATSPSPQPTIATTPIPLPEIRTTELAVDFTTQHSAESSAGTALNQRGLTINQESQTASWLSAPLAVTLAAPAPFLALSAQWSSVISPEAKLIISVRASHNRMDWGDWQLSSLDGDPRTHTGLFFLPADSQWIQYRIEMERDAQRNAPQLRTLKFRFISPGATPPDELENLQVATIVARRDWHCPPSSYKPKPQLSRIRHLIVHHTATANDRQDWPAVVRAIWNFHAVTNGWRDLGYHYLIDPNGVIYEGRAGGLQSIGIHFSCANSGTMGVAMIGNYQSTAPNPAALQSLQQLLATQCQQLGLNPLGNNYHPSTRLTLPTIAGHLNANASKSSIVCAGTHCPGEKLYSLLPQIRAEAKKHLETKQLAAN